MNTKNHRQRSGYANAQTDHPLHRGYVHAVKDALGTHGLHVIVVQIGGVALWHADLELSTADRTTAVLLRWDELNGWTCQTRGAVPSTEISFGVSAVPEPTQVADWVTTVLAHPHVKPHRKGGPFVTPDLTSRLGRYCTNAAT